MYKLIVKDNCPVCEGSVDKLTKLGLIDKVEVLHISSPEGLALAKEYKLKMAGSDIIDTTAQVKMTIEDFITSQQ